MKKRKVILCLWLLLLIFTIYCNWKYKVIAVHPFGTRNSTHNLRVLTWNICGATINSKEEQEDIARLIIAQDADFIQLNEFYLDSCLVIDSQLSEYYPYKEDVKAKRKSGDIFYSKIPLIESGKFIPNVIYSKMVLGEDSLYVLGCHLPGNNHEGQIEIGDTDSFRRVKTFWGRYRHAQEKRKKKIHYLKEKIQVSPCPIIVMGDMNDFICHIFRIFLF